MNISFDYLIIGSGLAGLQLALKMAGDGFFTEKSIALIDPLPKDTNDKTWCFWEVGTGQWDELLFKTWSHGKFITQKEHINLSMEGYRYKMLRAVDFYTYAKKQLSQHDHITFVQDEVVEVKKTECPVEVLGRQETYRAQMVFDSRLPQAYHKAKDKHVRIFQHFKGWTIETDRPVFDPDRFTMMDYRVKFHNDTSFTYVLPLSPQKALVEFTFFTPYTVEPGFYDRFLKRYIDTILNISSYRICETELGTIPMTTFPFHKGQTGNYTKIGTAGGWVKSASGYAFKHTEKKVEKLIKNIKKGEKPSKNILRKRFRFYDKIFLNVLKEHNDRGEWVFERFYKTNSAVKIFKFLDEETTPKEDLKIISGLFSWMFIRVFFRSLF